MKIHIMLMDQKLDFVKKLCLLSLFKVEAEKLILKFIWESKGSKNHQNNIEQKKTGRLTSLNLEISFIKL